MNICGGGASGCRFASTAIKTSIGHIFNWERRILCLLTSMDIGTAAQCELLPHSCRLVFAGSSHGCLRSGSVSWAIRTPLATKLKVFDPEHLETIVGGHPVVASVRTASKFLHDADSSLSLWVPCAHNSYAVSTGRGLICRKGRSPG